MGGAGVARAVPRVWLQESLSAPELEAFEDRGSSTPQADARARHSFRARSEAQSIQGEAASRAERQMLRSNIQTGSSSHRPTSPPSKPQRRASPPALLMTSWTRTARPYQGCHAYSTSRSSILWALSRRVVQSSPASLVARLSRPGAGGVRASLGRVAGCAISNSSAGHATAGAETDYELTLRPDHHMGADQARR